jgi:plasmid stability protein
MGQVTIRNLPVWVIRNFKVRVVAHGRSVEAELRGVLERVHGGPSAGKFWQRIDEFRLSEAGPEKTDSLDLLRQDRWRDA